MQNLQKKHALLEADVSSHAERIDAIRNQAEQFIEKGHFDADNIKAKRVSGANLLLVLCVIRHASLPISHIDHTHPSKGKRTS